jgi:hypothetical protein
MTARAPIQALFPIPIGATLGCSPGATAWKSASWMIACGAFFTSLPTLISLVA